MGFFRFELFTILSIFPLGFGVFYQFLRVCQLSFDFTYLYVFNHVGDFYFHAVNFTNPLLLLHLDLSQS